MQILASWRAVGASAALSSLLVVAGCGGGEKPSPPEPEPETVSEPAGEPQGEMDPADIPVKIDIAATRETARTAMFVPAPSEFQAALKASAPDIDIRKLVQDSGRTLDGKSRSLIALETGVRISNVLMSARSGDKPAIVGRMKAAREGLMALQAPADVVGQVDRVLADYEGGTLTNDELGPAMDVLAEQIQDDLEAKTDKNVATLVQAGGWVQGANLLATAIGSAGLAGDAAALLHQPTVLAYFLDFLKNSDPARAGDPNVTAVITEMEAMQALAGKAELTNADVKAIAAHTAAILAKF